VAYYLRAFCTSDEIPPLRTVLEWADDQGTHLEPRSADPDDSAWKQAEVICKSGAQPFIAERNAGELLREEVEEFMKFLADVDESPEKQEVLDHLGRSRTVVATQLLSDIDDDGYSAVGTFLTYFVEHCGGLIQADGEGFYKGDRLIVELE
jgi:hypothetical protein